MVALGSLYGPEASRFPRPTPQHTHASIAVLFREGEDGLEFLVMEYDERKGGEIQIKFPAGTNKDQTEETLIQTLAREVLEETGLIIPVSTRWIWSGPREENRRDRDGPGTHQKVAFLIPLNECRGEMRKLPMLDTGGTWLSPPFLRTAGELLIPVEEGGLFYTHRPALEKACEIAREEYLS